MQKQKYFPAQIFAEMFLRFIDIHRPSHLLNVAGDQVQIKVICIAGSDSYIKYIYFV